MITTNFADDLLDARDIEIAELKSQCMNLMGKLQVLENVIPQSVVQLSSLKKLIVEHDEYGNSVIRLLVPRTAGS